MNNIISQLIDYAHLRCDRIAIIEGNVKLSYNQLLNAVKSIASRLDRKGISKNDKVLMFVPMSIELYVYMLAVWYRGASVVFIDAWADASRIEKALNTIPCTAFIGSPKAHLLRITSKEIRNIKINIWAFIPQLQCSCTTEITPVETASEDTALVTFTTGSSGIPKAANRTHGFLLQQHAVLKNHMYPEDGDIEFICLPVFVLNCLASGNTACIPPINPAKPHLFKPEKIAELLKKNECTTIIASPVFFEILAHYYSCKGVIPNVKRAFLGGAPVSGTLARRIVSAFKNTDVEIVYGSTEAEPIASIKAGDLYRYESKHESIPGLLAGKPSPHITIRIIKINDASPGPITSKEFDGISCASNVTGEIVVHGEHVLKEYLNCPDAQRVNKFSVDGEVWHRTGDAGYLDTEGFLHLMGHVKQRIFVSGKDVFPLDIERKISDVESIRMGTIIEIDKKVYCVIELQNRAEIDDKDVLDIVNKYGIDSENGIIRTKIPRDPRHHSKIDYEKLGLIVKKILLNR